MTCDYCHQELEPRKSGKSQRFCSGGDHRKAYYDLARKIGVKILRLMEKERVKRAANKVEK